MLRKLGKGYYELEFTARFIDPALMEQVAASFRQTADVPADEIIVRPYVAPAVSAKDKALIGSRKAREQEIVLAV